MLIDHPCTGMGKRCLGSALKSFNSLLRLDTSLQLLLQGQCQGDNDLLANKCFKVFFWFSSFNSDCGAGGSGLQLLTWSPSARSSSSLPCTSTLPILRTAATMVLVRDLARADTLLTATSPQMCSGWTTQFCHHYFGSSILTHSQLQRRCF